MTNESSEIPAGESPKPRNFDLAERTAKFGERVITFVLNIPRNAITSPLINQLVRSSTSIGANYCEADEAGSKREFVHRISICCREARETKYWLRMLVSACPDFKLEAREIWREADEINRIFAAIQRRSKA